MTTLASVTVEASDPAAASAFYRATGLDSCGQVVAEAAYAGDDAVRGTTR